MKTPCNQLVILVLGNQKTKTQLYAAATAGRVWVRSAGSVQRGLHGLGLWAPFMTITFCGFRTWICAHYFILFYLNMKKKILSLILTLGTRCQDSTWRGSSPSRPSAARPRLPAHWKGRPFFLRLQDAFLPLPRGKHFMVNGVGKNDQPHWVSGVFARKQ